jgi:hypothetical protein
MIAIRLIKSSVLCVLAAALLALVGGASPALASSPWWHLNSGSRPADLRPGSAEDEVQELTVSATGGELALEDQSTEEFDFFPWNASAQELQEGLEGLYGKGNVQVTGGPADAAGSKPYAVTFAGALADQAVRPIHAYNIFLEGGRQEANLVETVKGQADGQIVVTASNFGDASTDTEVPAQITDKLPHGLKAVSIAGTVVGNGYVNGLPPLPCSLQSLTCTVTERTAPYAKVEMLIDVVVEGTPAAGEGNEVSVSGGGAASAAIDRPLSVGTQTTPFGPEGYELLPENEGGTPDTQAGSHPFQLTTTLALNQDASGYPVALSKDLEFKVPPGLVGNPTVLPQCTLKQFLVIVNEINECPSQTAIGLASVTVDTPTLGLNQLTFVEPLFNLEPAVGEPARFGFYVVVIGGSVPVILDTSVRSGGDYGVTVSVNNIVQAAGFVGSQVTFWGVPGDPRHDNLRGWSCLEESRGFEPKGGPCNPSQGNHPPPFLSLPTSCTGPLQSTLETDSWDQEGLFSAIPAEAMPALDGCNRLPFTPSVKVTPDGQAGSTPTGLTVDEHVSQLSTLATEGLAESDVKGLSVTLPEGVALNPAAADGLQACSLEQIALQSDAAPTCSEAAKVATVKVKTPLLPQALEGAAYLATQDANPFGSLVAMYIYAEDPISGVRVKAAGEVLENPVTGQLTAHFEGDPVFESDPRYASLPAAQFLPELAYEDIELHFFGGDRAPLATPAKCGTYTTTGTFTPWSGNPTTESSSEFQVVSGPNGSPCHDPLPFAPSLTAGTTSIQAGGFSPFTMTMSRADGSQNLNSIQLKMPPGLLGTLSSVKLCGEPQADQGTCGPESLIGHTTVSVGVGGDPYTVTGGEVFITGPYKGAPYGLSIVNPAKAGPFDLGKVIVRAKIEIDQATAALTITTDETGPYKIPTIIQGIPLQIQHVNVSIDRSGFTFNPTDCNPLAITGSLTSSEGSSAALSVPFQATNCAVLAFKPKLTASASGKTSRANGASLTVKLGYPAGPYDANISRVKVELPKRLPSRLTTLQKACTAAVFEANPANCPAASIIGHATATTPVLPVPLTGPAIFVSHGGEAFPSLIIVLQGYGATVHLVGSTFISKQGITSSTFKTVPDVPVGTFELTLPEGPYSALAANGNLCKSKLTMPTEFLGQNGALIKTTTKIAVTGCPKAKQVKHKQKRKATHRKKPSRTGSNRGHRKG